MLLNPQGDNLVLCPECQYNKFEEKDIVQLVENKRNESLSVVKRYKSYVCARCGCVVYKEVQVPV